MKMIANLEYQIQPINFPVLDLPIILASSSPFRKLILEATNIPFTVHKVDFDESSIHNSNVELLVLELAQTKGALATHNIKHPALIISGDSLVTCGNEIRGKPTSTAEARRYLRSYNEQPATTHSAICIHNTATGKVALGVDRADIYLKELNEEIISIVINEGTIFHCCGAVAIEHPLLSPFVDRIEGTLDSIMGMPLKLTEDLITQTLYNPNSGL
jgi:septum formation protein